MIVTSYMPWVVLVCVVYGCMYLCGVCLCIFVCVLAKRDVNNKLMIFVSSYVLWVLLMCFLCVYVVCCLYCVCE